MPRRSQLRSQSNNPQGFPPESLDIIMKIFDTLLESALKFSNRIAAVHLENRISYEELYQRSRMVADYISGLHLTSGSRIGILYENSIEYIYLYFAIFGAGHVPVPLDTSLKPERLNFILSDCGASALIIQSKFQKYLPMLLEPDGIIKEIITDNNIQPDFPGLNIKLINNILSKPINETIQQIKSAKNKFDPKDASDELAAIFYTSGSTGAPKGVMLSHKNLLSNTFSTIEYLELKSDDSVLVILPFYYIYGNSLLLTHIAAGGTVIIDNRFMYPEVILKTMEKEKVTGFSGVPSNFMILLNKSTFPDREFKYLRYFTQAGGSMAPDVITKVKNAFPDKQIFIMYGQTEASPRVSYLPPEQLENKIGSIGIPIPGVDIKIMNEDAVEVPNGESGELVVTGDNVMLGYWNRDDEENQVIRNGSLFTGDLAKKDEDGYIYIIGRKKEIIKSGGNRVSTKEVEDCILEHDLVVEAVVFGVADDLLGEAIKAVVVTKEYNEISEDEIKQFCRIKLADFKIPKKIEFMESLPKYQSGKIDKVQLIKNNPNE